MKLLTTLTQELSPTDNDSQTKNYLLQQSLIGDTNYSWGQVSCPPIVGHHKMDSIACFKVLYLIMLFQDSCFPLTGILCMKYGVYLYYLVISNVVNVCNSVSTCISWDILFNFYSSFCLFCSILVWNYNNRLLL